MGLIDFDTVLDDLLLLDLDLDGLLRGLLLYDHRLGLGLNLNLLRHWRGLGGLCAWNLTLHFLHHFDLSAFSDSDSTITTISRAYLQEAADDHRKERGKFRKLAPIRKIFLLGSIENTE